MSNDYQLKTKNGYDLMEVRSALQKMIRRGKLEESLYWAVELYESSFEAYLIYTLSVISAEDVAHYNPATYAAINSSLNLWHSLLTERKKKKQRTELRPALGTIIVMLVSSRKTRIGDDSWQWVEIQRRNGLWLDLPDVCFDEHTKKGKEMKRSFIFWVRQSSKVHPKATASELGLQTDFSEEVNAYYLKNSPIPDESEWSEWNPNDPDAEIQEYKYDKK